jgi:hypothetical protein
MKFSRFLGSPISTSGRKLLITGIIKNGVSPKKKKPLALTQLRKAILVNRSIHIR